MRLSEHEAKHLVHSEGRSRLEQLLTLLATDDKPMSVATVKQIASKCGLRSASQWNVSDILRKSNGYAILTHSGWELTERGGGLIGELASKSLTRPIVKRTVADVRRHVDKITSDQARDFIEEAVTCFENGQFRAAVVFSWVGAVSTLQSYVISRALNAFNAEARRRDARWKDARNTDELGRMKEREFLDVLEAIGLIGKNVKQMLQDQCLNLRNACGHPNSLRITENNVASHLDTLVLNVYSAFQVA